MDKPRRQKIHGRFQIMGIIAALLILGALTALGIRWTLSLDNPDKLAAFQDMLASLGVGGWFVLLALQWVQIVLAFIPGGPIQILLGALYGPLGGLCTCLLGAVAGTATAFTLVHRFGRKVIHLFVNEGDILKYHFLRDAKKLELLVIILFFIPGTPKDALTYLFALSPLPMRRFMLLSTLARIPALLTSVLAGNSIIQGNWLQAGIYFAVISAVSLCGLLLHKKILRAFRRHRPYNEL